MRYKTLLYYLVNLLFVFSFAYSCVADFDIDNLSIDTSTQVVVNSILSPDRPISIILKWSRDDNNTTHFKWVQNAVIKIWENDLQIINENSEDGKFTSNYYPKHGSKYRLKVTVPDYGEVYAETTIPYPPKGNMSFVKTMVYDPDNEHYQHVNVSEMGVEQKLRALWIIARYKYEHHRDIYSPRFYYPNTMEIDQINVYADGINVSYKGSNIECEGFIRIPYDYLATTANFSLSFLADPFIYTLIELPGTENLQQERCFIDFLAIDFISPSEEYDRYCRSVYKQYYFRYDPETPFLNENVVIQGNIKNGLGIFAGYGVYRAKFDGYKDYYINNFGS